MAYMVGHGYKAYYSVSTDGSGNPVWEVFGTGTRISSLGANNNIERVYVLGKRTPGALVPLRFEGSWSIETHPVSLEVLQDFGLDSKETPVKGEVAIVDDGNNVIRKLVDAVVQRATISARQGEIARLTLDGVYKKDDYSGGSINPGESEGTVPLTFADGQVTFDGKSLGIVQSFEASINMNADPVYGLGSRLFKDVILKAFEAEGRATVMMTVDEYKSFLQARTLQSDSDSLSEFDIVLSLGSSNLRLVAGLINEITHSLEPNEIVLVDMVFYATDVQIT